MQIVLDGKKFNLEFEKKEYLIYQYCYKKGIELPCFCYNENLEIAGNCRICLVEVSTSPKLLLSCATKVDKNMIIKTKSRRVQRVRKSIVEFLLINHPLDCPICDQGGECDLQNITQSYGLDRGRFYEFSKRSVLDKESGFFIKTIMTRCIHCTRCVRFFKEVENLSGFGIMGRGEETEIVTKKENLLSILSGNVVDMCPVGALTSKVYTFTARPWELNKYENIDILDSMCSSINLDLRNNKILRILPVSDSFLNNDWITNITRYFFDGLVVQRLLKPFLILKNTYLDLSWLVLTKILIRKVISTVSNNYGIGFFLSDFFDLGSLIALKNLSLKFGYLNINVIKNYYVNNDFNFFYFFNSKLLTLNDYFYYFFISINLRLKMPLLNSKLRLLLKRKEVKLFSIGFVSFDISFFMLNLGNNLKNLLKVLENKSSLNKNIVYSSFFVNQFFSFVNKFKNLALIIGDNFFLFKNTYKLLQNFISFFYINVSNVYCLFTDTIALHYNELNLKSKKNLDLKFFFNFYSLSNSLFIRQKKSFSVLQTSNFSSSIKNNNLILPVSSFFEYDGNFLNFEGRLRKKLKAYSYSHAVLKSNNDILKYFNLIVKKVYTQFLFNFSHLQFFSNLLFLNSFDLIYKKNLILNFLNLDLTFNSQVFFFNHNVFDYLVNIYKFKGLYKNSVTLHKVSSYLNSYLNVFV